MKVLGFIISIESVKNNRSYSSRFSSPVCKVKQEDGHLFLYDLQGNKLPKQISIELIEDCFSPSRAKVELYVDLTELK